MNLDDFSRKILEPSIQKLEAKKGKPREQIVEDNERRLEPHRQVMAHVAEDFCK